MRSALPLIQDRAEGQCWAVEGPVRARLTDENSTGLSAVVD